MGDVPAEPGVQGPGQPEGGECQKSHVQPFIRQIAQQFQPAVVLGLGQLRGSHFRLGCRSDRRRRRLDFGASFHGLGFLCFQDSGRRASRAVFR